MEFLCGSFCDSLQTQVLHKCQLEPPTHFWRGSCENFVPAPAYVVLAANVDLEKRAPATIRAANAVFRASTLSFSQAWRRSVFAA